MFWTQPLNPWLLITLLQIKRLLLQWVSESSYRVGLAGCLTIIQHPLWPLWTKLCLSQATKPFLFVGRCWWMRWYILFWLQCRTTSLGQGRESYRYCLVVSCSDVAELCIRFMPLPLSKYPFSLCLVWGSTHQSWQLILWTFLIWWSNPLQEYIHCAVGRRAIAAVPKCSSWRPQWVVVSQGGAGGVLGVGGCFF
jgi:hypothetical protein